MIKQGDHVRLKDSPYEGEVESSSEGWRYIRFRTRNGTQITVSDPDLLEPVLMPKVGDLYEDKNGFEWIIRDAGSLKYTSALPFLVAQVLDRPRSGYPHGCLTLNKPRNLQDWIETYEPKLRRRRGQ